MQIDAFIRRIGQPELQNLLSLAILNQTKSKQFMHLTPKQDCSRAAKLMEGLCREIMREEIGYQDVTSQK